MTGVLDRLGHSTGDTVLRVVAHPAAALLRKTDVVARLGGDEPVRMADELMYSVKRASKNAVVCATFAG